MRVLVACPTFRRSGQAALDAACGQDVLLVQGNPFDDPHCNVLWSYQRARRVALSEEYDALFCVEEDMIVPEDALPALYDIDAEVVTGVYRYRSDRSLNVRPRPKRLKGTAPVQRGGMGCLLIRRAVLEAVPFRIEEGGGYPDSYFWQDVQDFRCRAALEVQCGHIDDGEVITV